MNAPEANPRACGLLCSAERASCESWRSRLRVAVAQAPATLAQDAITMPEGGSTGPLSRCVLLSVTLCNLLMAARIMPAAERMTG